MGTYFGSLVDKKSKFNANTVRVVYEYDHNKTFEADFSIFLCWIMHEVYLLHTICKRTESNRT